MFYADDCGEENYCPNLAIERSFKEVEIIQSIGLLDRNGKEIFEGDIVVIGGSKVIPIHQDVVYTSWFLEDIKNKVKEAMTLLDITCRKESEIIGNIYENQELLER